VNVLVNRDDRSSAESLFYVAGPDTEKSRRLILVLVCSITSVQLSADRDEVRSSVSPGPTEKSCRLILVLVCSITSVQLSADIIIVIIITLSQVKSSCL